MDQETIRVIIVTVLSSFVSIAAGAGLWNFLSEWLKRRVPTPIEAVETEAKASSIALDIASSLRIDVDRLREELNRLDTDRDQCREEIQSLRLSHLDQIKNIETKYENQLREMRTAYDAEMKTKIESIQKQYEEQLKRIKIEYDAGIESHTKKIRELEGKVRVLESEGKELRELKKVIESGHG